MKPSAMTFRAKKAFRTCGRFNAGQTPPKTGISLRADVQFSDTAFAGTGFILPVESFRLSSLPVDRYNSVIGLTGAGNGVPSRPGRRQ